MSLLPYRPNVGAVLFSTGWPGSGRPPRRPAQRRGCRGLRSRRRAASTPTRTRGSPCFAQSLPRSAPTAPRSSASIRTTIFPRNCWARRLAAASGSANAVCAAPWRGRRHPLNKTRIRVRRLALDGTGRAAGAGAVVQAGDLRGAGDFFPAVGSHRRASASPFNCSVIPPAVATTQRQAAIAAAATPLWLASRCDRTGRRPRRGSRRSPSPAPSDSPR